MEKNGIHSPNFDLSIWNKQYLEFKPNECKDYQVKHQAIIGNNCEQQPTMRRL
jgi:hypothetical protein